jgi:hypothetical protein
MSTPLHPLQNTHKVYITWIRTPKKGFEGLALYLEVEDNYLEGPYDFHILAIRKASSEATPEAS